MRKVHSRAGAATLLAIAVFAGGVLRAKPSDGVLTGVVVNGRGAPVSHADVFWQGADGQAPHAAHCDASGKFRIPGVRQGLYDLRAEAAGMTSDWEHNVVVRPGGEASVTLRLSHAISATKKPLTGNPHAGTAGNLPY